MPWTKPSHLTPAQASTGPAGGRHRQAGRQTVGKAAGPLWKPGRVLVIHGRVPTLMSKNDTRPATELLLSNSVAARQVLC
jgi:hypothetical protein